MSAASSSQRRRRNPNEDRLSLLPDHLLHHIFKSFYFHVIMETRLISKRFRYLWVTSPTLKFRSRPTQPKLKEIINQALLQYNSPTLQDLEIDIFESDFGSNDKTAAFWTWIIFAVRHNIQHLNLYLVTCRQHYPQLHSSIYQCLSLQSLSLVNFNLNHPSIHFPSLKTISVADCILSNIQILVDCCPRLEELEVYDAKQLKDLKIDARHHNYLKKLSLGESHHNPTEIKNQVEVLAPKLQSFTLHGILRHTYVISELPSLTFARLTFYYGPIGETGCGVTWRNFYLENFDFDRLMKRILAVSHVQTLILDDWSFLAISMRERKEEDIILLSATRLELYSVLSEWGILGISHLFKGLHHLQELKIYMLDEEGDERISSVSVPGTNIDARGLTESRYCKPLDVVLSRGQYQLKTIKFYFGRPNHHKWVDLKPCEYVDGLRAFWLLKCFVKNCESLEVVYIKAHRWWKTLPERGHGSIISRKLQRMRRRGAPSNKLKVVFI